jgi:hypothetical protein
MDGECRAFSMRTVKLLVSLAAAGLVVWVLILLVPPFFSNYQFQDAINNEALLSSYTTKSDDAIRDDVFKKAQDYEIPVTSDQIHVERTGNNALVIWTDYTVHVDLPMYPIDLKFHPASKNKPI